MKAYLIDPFARSVTEVQISDTDHAPDIYRLTECETFAVSQMTDVDGVYVDDEGLINGRHQKFFFFPGASNPLAGKGLVLGCDDQGETIEPAMSLSDVRAMVTFLSNSEVRRMYA